jgi:hypothetical protein
LGLPTASYRITLFQNADPVIFTAQRFCFLVLDGLKWDERIKKGFECHFLSNLLLATGNGQKAKLNIVFCLLPIACFF